MPIPERFPRAWLLANALAFQCIWWLLILAGPQQPALAALALAAWLAAHLWLSDTRRADLAALAALPTLGPWLDVLIEAAGWLEYHGQRPMDGWATYWIIGLWAAFALTLNHSLRAVISRPLLAVGFGAIGGALAYLAGARFGAASLPADPVPALIGIGAAWAGVMALLSVASIRFERKGVYA